MKNLIFTLIAVGLLSGCSSFKQSDLSQQQPDTNGAGLDGGPDQNGAYSPEMISPVPQGLGLVYWSGIPNVVDEQFKRGMDFLLKEGFQTFRLVVAPQTPSLYKINPGCDPSKADFLKCLVSQGTLERVLAHPRLKIANLVVYDTLTSGAAGDQRKFLNSDFLEAHRASIILAYEELAFELASRFSKTGKKFIISDWEGDNTIYCGSAYNFVQNPEITDPDDAARKVYFRNWCLARYSSIYGGQAQNPDQAMSGYRKWHELRIEGIERGQRRAREYGATDVIVQSGMEFSTLKLLTNAGFSSALEQVAMQLAFDVVTYSSYESINAGTLIADLDELKTKLGSKRLAISEFGFSEASFGASARHRLRDVTTELLRRLENKDIDYATAWQGFQDGSASEFGLYGPGFARTSLGDGLWDGIRAHVDTTLKPLITNAGGSCSEGWILGARIPEAQNLKVQIHDQYWVLKSELPLSAISRKGAQEVVLAIPAPLRSTFKNSGLRFTVRDVANTQSYAMGPLVMCD